MSGKVDIQGAVSEQEMSSKAQIKSEVEVSAQEMDMIKPIPVETTMPSRDIKESKIESEKIKEAKEANEETLSAIRQAEPEKAKKRQVRKRKNVEPTPPAGTPSIDYLQVMQDRFDRMEKMQQEVMSNLQKVYASETSLQQSGISANGKRMRMEGPNHNQSFVDMNSGDHPKKIPISYREPPMQPRQQPVSDTHEIDLYRRRNKEALDSMMYDTEETMYNRGASNPSNPQKTHYFNRW